MQTITITGYLSRDAEQRSTQTGDSITTWNVPVRQGFGDREKTNWFRVSIWGKRAQFAANARKGEFVTVTGELEIGEYEGKPQYNIRANDFQSVRTAPRDGGTDAPSEPQRNSRQTMGAAGMPVSDAFPADIDDDIPFLTMRGIW